jgi:hypothetical protein
MSALWKKITTFERAMTPSKLMALFRAVNKSSAHPEISSCQHLYQPNNMNTRDKLAL